MDMLRVTITGADDDVKPEALFELSKCYPFVEWGFLWSEKRAGTPRYPSQERLLRALAARPTSAHVAIHLCGKVARDFMAGEVSYWSGNLLHGFSGCGGRIQVNGFGGRPHESWRDLPGEIILQARSRLQLKVLGGRALGWPNTSVLYDPSGGTGVSVPHLPKAPAGVRMGFAGGIGPDNVDWALAMAVEKSASWIDMESGVRDGRDQFDLEKVGRVLYAAARFFGRNCERCGGTGNVAASDKEAAAKGYTETCLDCSGPWSEPAVGAGTG